MKRAPSQSNLLQKELPQNPRRERYMTKAEIREEIPIKRNFKWILIGALVLSSGLVGGILYFKGLFRHESSFSSSGPPPAAPSSNQPNMPQTATDSPLLPITNFLQPKKWSNVSDFLLDLGYKSHPDTWPGRGLANIIDPEGRTDTGVLQVTYPGGTVGSASGITFYGFPGFPYDGINEMTLDYSVYFPTGFKFTLEGKLPGLWGDAEPGISEFDCSSMLHIEYMCY